MHTKLLYALSTLLLLMAPVESLKSQTVLAPGDIAVIGINTGGSGDDAIKLVTLVDLECNTEFVVTDDNWSFGGWPCSSSKSEFGVRITVTQRILSGSVFYLDIESSGDLPNSTVSTGAMTITDLSGAWGTNFGLNSGGDNVHVLQGSPDERTSPLFIFSVKHGSGYSDSNTCSGGGAVNNTGLPTGLTIGTNALVIASGQDQWHYDCSTSITSGTKSGICTSICNSSNWTTSATQLVWDNSTCFFNVTDQTPVDGILAVSGAGCGCLSGCDLTGMGGTDCGSGTTGNCSAGYQTMSVDITVPADCQYSVVATMRSWNSCSASGADAGGSCPSCDRLKVDVSGGGKGYQSGSSNATLNDNYTMPGPGTVTISGQSNRADEVIVYRVIKGSTSDLCATCATVLPVEVTSFSGGVDGVKVVLDWATASETGASHFEVEKSSNGKEWELLSLMPAVGNSSKPVYYQLTDSSPFTGTGYYKLTEVDVDGTQRYSSVISVYMPGERQIVKYVNLMGQEVDAAFSGVVIVVYSDGSTEKMSR